MERLNIDPGESRPYEILEDRGGSYYMKRGDVECGHFSLTLEKFHKFEERNPELALKMRAHGKSSINYKIYHRYFESLLVYY